MSKNDPTLSIDYRALLRGLPGFYLILAPDYTILDASDAYLAATMTRRDAIVGRGIFEVFPDNPQNERAGGAANLRDSLQSVLKERRPHVMAIQRYDLIVDSMAVDRQKGDSDGHAFEVRYWSPINSPVLDDNGQVRWIVHRVEDVTEFILMKQQHRERQSLALHDRMSQVEAEVYRSAQDVRAARDEANRASTAKTKFIAAISHDLRQPVQAQLLFLDVLQRQKLPDTLRGPLNTVMGSVRVLKQMLDGLLDLARLDAGIVQPRIRPFRLDRLIEDLYEEFLPQAAAAGLILNTAVPPIGCSSDPLLLNQILRNLISNALKYTPEGTVELRARHQNGQVVLTVADTGIGIPKDKQSDIFDDYFQVGNPSRDPSRGLGLGLGTVKRTAALLDHPVAVQSEPGHGSQFTILLPWAEADVVADSEIGPLKGDLAVAQRSLAGRRVLLVEDEHRVALAMTGIMRQWGLHVSSAGSLTELEARLPSLQRPDILVTDDRLPDGQTGGEVIAAVHRYWDTPAIIVTGDTAEHRLQGARSLGCFLLHKPITSEDLLLALAQHL